MAREQDTSCFLAFPEHSAILKFGLPVSNGHTEAPGPARCGGLLGPWAPPLIQGAQCLCPCPGAPDGDPCGSRRTPLPRKPPRRDRRLRRDSTEPVLFLFGSFEASFAR